MFLQLFYLQLSSLCDLQIMIEAREKKKKKFKYCSATLEWIRLNASSDFIGDIYTWFSPLN